MKRVTGEADLIQRVSIESEKTYRDRQKLSRNGQFEQWSKHI